MRYRRKPTEPEEVEAIQWREFGDSEDIRYFRHPYLSGELNCPFCQNRFHLHGWIDHPPFGTTVCPGNYIIKHQDGTFSVCGPEEFEKEWEEI